MVSPALSKDSSSSILNQLLERLSREIGKGSVTIVEPTEAKRSLSNNMLRSTLLNAALRCNNTKTETCPLSMLKWMSFKALNKSSLLLWGGWNPDWKTLRRLFQAKKVLNLFNDSNKISDIWYGPVIVHGWVVYMKFRGYGNRRVWQNRKSNITTEVGRGWLNKNCCTVAENWLKRICL